MRLIRFVGDGDDVVDSSVLHLDGVIGSDYTLCGLTLDGDQGTAGSFESIDAPAVTCPDCVRVILHCRGVRVKNR